MLQRSLQALAGFIALGIVMPAVSGVLTPGPVQGSEGTSQPPYPEVTVLLGNTEDRIVHSSAVNYDYRISVALPLSYSTNTRKAYPVLYVLDPHLSFGTVTDVVRVGAVGGELPELIVVGIGYPEDIAGARALRERDYRRAPGPFLEFVRDALIPLIDADYRTDPSDRGIIGHSYGGDFALYVLFSAPGTFSRYMVGSPDFNAASALERCCAADQSALPASVLLSIGERDEASSSERLLTEFVKALESHAYEGLEISTLIFDGASHFASRPLHHVSGVYAMYRVRP